MTALSRAMAGRIAVALALGTLMAAPLVGLADAYVARLIMLTAIMSLMVSGLNIVWGYAGQLAVGQVALYAMGAYATAYLANHLGVHDVLVTLGAVSLAGVAVGLVTGVPSLRLAGWGLAMATFFLVLIVPDLVEVFGRWTGGALGTSVDSPTLFGSALSTTGYYVLLMAVTTGWFLVARNLIHSPHGRVMLVIRESPVLAAALGVSVYRTKLLVYVLSAIPAAVAGAMFAWLDGYLAPESFTFSVALQVLAASVIGGTRSTYGAIAGSAIVVVGLTELAAFESLLLIMWGAFLIITGITFSGGIAGLVGRVVHRLGAARGSAGIDLAVAPVAGHGPAPAPVDAGVDVDGGPLTSVTGVPLQLTDLRKAFGGNVAVDGVTLAAEPGQVTAFIGPNGSGKTTLLNLVNGFYACDAGTAVLGDQQISGLSAHRVARAGVARTFQTPVMPEGITVRDFVALARFDQHGPRLAMSLFRLPPYRASQRRDREIVERVLVRLGLIALADVEVSELPLGTRRLVELARVIVAQPRLVLLDEVGSGLDAGELEHLGAAIGLIRDSGAVVVLVEHNMPFVMGISDRVHVLSRGGLLATGTPSQIQEDESVLAEYTGRRAEAAR